MIGKFNVNKAGGIDSFNSVRQGETSKAGPTSGSAKAEVEGNSASIEVSARASLLRSAMTQIAELPEIREDVVARYKDLIESGQYQRTDNLIAEAMIRDEA
jgi:flagellar biosynthesis anti-sigma factor FlgM